MIELLIALIGDPAIAFPSDYQEPCHGEVIGPGIMAFDHCSPALGMTILIDEEPIEDSIIIPGEPMLVLFTLATNEADALEELENFK